MNRSLVAILFFSMFCGLPLLSRAQGGVDDKAKEAFDRGKALFESADYSASADAFREAYLLKPSWKLLYNIGQAEAAAKRYGLALEAFEKYLAEGGDELSIERRKSVINEVEQLRAMVGSIEVKAPDGAVVFVDGVERGKAPLPGMLKVAAGVEHEVKIELEDLAEEPRKIMVSGGDVAKVEFGQGDTEPSEPSEPAVEEGEPAKELEAAEDSGVSKLKVAGWIGVGLGGAMLLGGGATGIATMSLNGELEDECVDGQCLPESHAKLEKRDALAITSDVLIWGGAAVAVAGATMLIVDAVSDEKPSEKAALVPTFGERQAGLSVVGRF